MSESVLSLNNVVKFYPGSHGLAMVTMQIEAGDIVGLVGSNGATALYLNYRERRLWPRDPAALLAVSAGKENL